MPLSAKARSIAEALDADPPRMGDIKKLAAETGQDHALATELWGAGVFALRLVAVLLMDKARLDQTMLEGLAADLEAMPSTPRNRISEWLLANQLMKSARTKRLIPDWADHPSPVLRRLYWYHQARLRWTGKVPVDNARQLLDVMQQRMAGEHEDVQWTMNLCAGWIGVYQPDFRAECIALGERLGLYKGDPVSKGCTPSYLPEFIRIEVAKRA